MSTDNDADQIVGEAAAAVMAAFEEFKSGYDARIAGIETAMRRTGSGPLTGEPGVKTSAPAEVKAFNSFMRRGVEAMDDIERKSLSLSGDTNGGYLATAEFSREIIKNLVQFSPVRDAARVGNMRTTELLIPVRTGAPTAYWVSETETRTGTQAAYGQKRIVAREMACYVDVSQQLLEDSEFDMQTEVSADLAEEFGRLEGLAFVSGDGVGKPLGFMSDTNITSVNSGSALIITADGLITTLYDLPAFYRNKATWMMNGTTLASCRKLKDGTGQYIWQPGIAAGQPETILGRPVVEAPDMPSEGAGLYPIAVGDFNQAYRIYDRVGMSILRDPFTQATSGLVRFHARRRVDGAVVKAEALRKVKCST